MTTNPQAFSKAFEAGKPQIVARWVPADLDTPVSAFLKLAANDPYAVLLESVEGGATLGRYSILGLKPDFFWRCDGQQAFTANADAENRPQDWQDEGTTEPLENLKRHIKNADIGAVPEGLPGMCQSGLFGYLGYDMVRLVEPRIPDSNPDELGIPDGLLMRPSVMIIFDNIKHMACIAVICRKHAGNCDEPAASVLQSLNKDIDDTLKRLHGAMPEDSTQKQSSLKLPLDIQSGFDQKTYGEAVSRAVEYIHAGDIFQVVPSQRFRLPFDLPAFALYRTLRRLNPSPFLFFVKMDSFALVGSSPEILVRVREKTVTIRPIAGTRKRGATEAEDEALATELLADPKERAEHLMLLDLARNDVGKIAEIGSVRVTAEYLIERYSHVMHIVSNVEGTLRQDCHPVDALFSGFPAGTVSGAPKIRAMEIIDELEPVKRKFYGGCVGYFSPNGDIDSCIALRTALVKDGEVILQAGGGVVADSTPDFEYQESCNKARALIQATEQAVAETRLD